LNRVGGKGTPGGKRRPKGPPSTQTRHTKKPPGGKDIGKARPGSKPRPGPSDLFNNNRSRPWGPREPRAKAKEGNCRKNKKAVEIVRRSGQRRTSAKHGAAFKRRERRGKGKGPFITRPKQREIGSQEQNKHDVKLSENTREKMTKEGLPWKIRTPSTSDTELARTNSAPQGKTPRQGG